MKAWQRIALRYFSLWLAGSLAVILVVIPSVRASIVCRELNVADRLLQMGQPANALARLERIELWSSLYPNLAQRLSYTAIRCHARLHDFAAAKLRARIFEDCYGSGRRPSKTLWESFQALPDLLINATLPSPSEVHGSLGYEVLINELKQIGDLEQIDRLAKEMLRKEPKNELAKKFQDYVIRARAEPKNGNAPPTPKSDIVEVDHTELARKHIAAKMWDQALQECELALKAIPGDARALALKRTAQARGRKWGCLRTAAKGYDTGGTFVRDLPALTVVDITGTRNSSGNGELAVCKVKGDDGTVSDLLVSAKAIDIRTGSLKSEKEEAKTLWMQRTKLLAEIEQLHERQREDWMKDNPFKAEYDAALADYRAYWAAEKALLLRHQKATGDERVALADELKAMKLKGDDVRLGRAMEETKKKMNDWQDKNGGRVPPSDAKITALEEQVARLQDRLSALDAEP